MFMAGSQELTWNRKGSLMFIGCQINVKLEYVYMVYNTCGDSTIVHRVQCKRDGTRRCDWLSLLVEKWWVS